MESPSDQIVSTGKIPLIDASVLQGPEEHQTDAIAQPPADKPVALPAADRGMSTDLDKMLPGLLAQAQAAERSKAEAGKEQALAEAEETAKYRTGAKDLYAKDKPAAFNPGAPPQKPNEDPLRQFGSLASMIGIFASAFTKKPIVNALNASSAAMNAQRAGDKEAYDIAYKEWQDQIKLGMEKHKMDTEDLNTGLNMLTTDYSAGMAYFKALGAAKSWDAVSALAQIGDATEIGKLHASLITAGNKAEENRIKMDTLFLKQKEALIKQDLIDSSVASSLKEMGVASIDKLPPQQKAEVLSKALMVGEGKISANGLLNADAINQTAERVLAGDKTALQGLGWGNIGSVNRAAVQNKLSEIARERGISGEDLAHITAQYQGELSKQRAVGNQAAKIELASNMLEQSLPSMMDAAKEVGLSKSTDLNKVYNMVKRHSSNQDFSNFSTQLRAVTSDYAQFIGRGRLTVHSDQEALRILNDDMGITSLQGFVDAVNIEKKNVKRAIEMTKTGEENDDVSLEKYSPEEYTKALKSGTLKKGDHFLTDSDEEHVVQ